MTAHTLRWKLAQSLEWRWWYRYLRKREPEAYLVWKHTYWLDILQRTGVDTTVLQGASVLDAGCGPAGIFIALSGSEVTAIDPLLAHYNELPHFNPANYPWVDFRPQRIENMQDIGCFQYAFCLNAINHVADIRACLGNLNAALVTGGTMILSTDVHRSSALRALFRALPGDVLHPQQHVAAAYQQFLQEAGFTLEREFVMKKGRVFDYRVYIARKDCTK